MNANQLHPDDVIVREGKELHILSVWHRPDGKIQLLTMEEPGNVVLEKNEAVTKASKK
jgi:hypothetical protein